MIDTGFGGSNVEDEEQLAFARARKKVQILHKAKVADKRR